MAEFSERKIPHQAIITISGIVYEQLQDGSINPVPKHVEETTLTNIGSTEKECSEEMITKIEGLKQSWINKENTQKK
tara:strand:- start:169 stop:399 length:231 start_codon:yes stop_codon:yes gene_type:complete